MPFHSDLISFLQKNRNIKRFWKNRPGVYIFSQKLFFIPKLCLGGILHDVIFFPVSLRLRYLKKFPTSLFHLFPQER